MELLENDIRESRGEENNNRSRHRLSQIIANVNFIIVFATVIVLFLTIVAKNDPSKDVEVSNLKRMLTSDNEYLKQESNKYERSPVKRDMDGFEPFRSQNISEFQGNFGGEGSTGIQKIQENQEFQGNLVIQADNINNLTERNISLFLEEEKKFIEEYTKKFEEKFGLNAREDAFIKSVSPKLYHGRWSFNFISSNSDSTLSSSNRFLNTTTSATSKKLFDFEHSEGVIEMSIFPFRSLYINSTNPKTVSTLRFRTLVRDGSYLDNWVEIDFSSELIEGKNIDYKKNTFSRKNLKPYIIHGEGFQQSREHSSSLANVTLTWKISDKNKDSSKINVIDEFFLSIDFGNSSSIGAKFSIKNDDQYKGDIIGYCTYAFIIAILQMLSNVHLLRLVSDSQANFESISFACFFLNALWNSYSCMILFMFGFQLFQDYLKYFFVPGIIYFFNFTIFDVKVLFYRWKLFYPDTLTIAEMKKALVKFYMLLYLCIFLQVVFIHQLLFNKYIVFINVSITWIFQIIHNIKYKTVTFMPLCVLVFNTLSKLILPVYYRNSDNFFEISPDTRFVCLLILSMSTQIVILCLQRVYGGMFPIPKALLMSSEQARETSLFDYYKTHKELLERERDFEKLECVICLQSLIFKDEIFVEHDGLSFNNSSQDSLIGKFKKTGNKFLKEFVEFKHLNLNRENKPFMATPCNHYFHSGCLEVWLKTKRECPTCRGQIPSL